MAFGVALSGATRDGAKVVRNAEHVFIGFSNNMSEQPVASGSVPAVSHKPQIN